MKLRICSDLHLEAFTGRNAETLMIDFLPAHSDDSSAVLILAGDISSRPEQLTAFIFACQSRFKHILYVPGNHEFYRNHYQKLNAELHQFFTSQCPKVTAACGNVVQVQIDDVIFILSTLWADGGRDAAEQVLVEQYLNDFRLIGYKDSKFKVKEMMHENAIHVKKIELALKSVSPLKKVVVTHHLPSYRLCHPRFGNSCNGGFASDLDYLLASDHAPALWVHGHTHDTIDTQLWNTRIVCNPRGYRGEWGSKFNTYDAVFIDV